MHRPDVRPREWPAHWDRPERRAQQASRLERAGRSRRAHRAWRERRGARSQRERSQRAQLRPAWRRARSSHRLHLPRRPGSWHRQHRPAWRPGLLGPRASLRGSPRLEPRPPGRPRARALPVLRHRRCRPPGRASPALRWLHPRLPRPPPRGLLAWPPAARAQPAARPAGPAGAAPAPGPAPPSALQRDQRRAPERGRPTLAGASRRAPARNREPREPPARTRRRARRTSRFLGRCAARVEL